MLDIENKEVAITEIYDDIWIKKNITLSLLRLDLIHPVVSGNKIFKLYYFLQKAIEQKLPVITFGGAHSNHLTATSAVCKHYGLPCIGIVRGEKPAVLSPSLTYCAQQDMHLEFISRNAYRYKHENTFLQNLQLKYGDHILMPEGGFSDAGVKGAAKIYRYIDDKSYTHLCCSVGTATTLAGLIKAAQPAQKVVGFSALKELDFEERLHLLLNPVPANYYLLKNYHFGGYAKKTNDLISFMNTFYKDHKIPLDFVYTGKMMYGVIDMIRQNYFADKSRIICIHTGGLQGNSSLMAGELTY